MSPSRIFGSSILALALLMGGAATALGRLNAGVTRLVFMSGGAFTARSQAFLTAVGRARIDKPLSVTVLRALLAAQQA